MFLKLLVILSLLNPITSFASFKSAASAYETGKLDEKNLKKIIRDLIDDDFFYATIPWLKEYIAIRSGKLTTDMDALLDEVITHTGLEQFEAMPINMLERSGSSTIQFILAKKKMNTKNYEEALNIIKGVTEGTAIYPFALHLRATAESMLDRNDDAIKNFEACADASDKASGKVKGERQKQLYVNRDSCIAGVARSYFAKKDFSKADSKYLDIPKGALIWPDILFEEAWNSFYLGNYNRTLGKLVTYKAPVLDFIFNPEVDVLKGYSYLKLCLWNDAKKAADDFYTQYMEPARELRLLINENKKDNEFFYKAGFNPTHDKTRNALLNNILVSIAKDSAFMGIKKGLVDATDEYQRLKGQGNSKLKNSMLRNLAEVLTVQRNIFGGYVKKQMIAKYASLFRSFQYMSYIKLEILDNKKAELYSPKSETVGKRGDEKYIERSDKQYFWTFNGEFWADELGDYVFALSSECK
ncbi:MAG: hypothetical protein ACOYL6_09600 [Bacteriovoracaceae bacterium]